MNRGVVRLDMQLLEGLLHLPDGHHIVAARQADGFIDAVDLLVEGPSLPDIAPGQVTPRVQLIVTVTEADVTVRERKFSGALVS